LQAKATTKLKDSSKANKTMKATLFFAKDFSFLLFSFLYFRFPHFPRHQQQQQQSTIAAAAVNNSSSNNKFPKNQKKTQKFV